MLTLYIKNLFQHQHDVDIGLNRSKKSLGGSFLSIFGRGVHFDIGGPADDEKSPYLLLYCFFRLKIQEP